MCGVQPVIVVHSSRGRHSLLLAVFPNLTISYGVLDVSLNYSMEMGGIETVAIDTC